MHYFKRNIGDYAKKAGRLSMLQHGAYTLLIDSCYDRERFPTLDEAIEWTWASTREEEEAVAFVLRRFFTLENGVYIQNRIKEEIAEYHDKAETNRRIAIERETKRRANATIRTPTVNDSPPNHKPRTINQEPLNQENKHTESKTPSPEPEPETVCVSSPTERITPTNAGLCCKAIIDQGIPTGNPSHPVLLELIKAGATEQEFAHAAREAVGRGNPTFAYVIGTVRRQREQAAKLVLHHGRMPNKQEALEASNRAATEGWVPPELREVNRVYK